MGHILEGKGPGKVNILYNSYSTLAINGSYIHYLILFVPKKRYLKTIKSL